MIYVLKIIWDYRVSLLELIIRNIVRYPQSATSTSIRYQPAIRYLHNFTREVGVRYGAVRLHCISSLHGATRYV
jgi:hypothetical protein